MTAVDVEIQSFHQGFSAPFSFETVAARTAEGPYPFPISIDGVGFVMDLKQWKHATLEQFRNQSDTSREPGEQSLSIEGVWKRTGTSAVRGAGQEFYDDEASDRTRFWRSVGIDAWEPRKVRLLPKTAKVRTSVAANQLCLTIGGHFLYVDDDEAYVTDDPRNPGATWTAQTLGSANPVTAVTTNGSTVYLACGASGIKKLTPGAPPATPFGSYQATFILYASGWLVATSGAEIVSLDSAGVPSSPPVWTHRNPDFRWVTGASAPNAIYLGGNSGDRAEFYRTAASSDGSSLTVPIFAGDLPAGETVNTMSYYSRLMLIGTSKGLRVATIDSDGGLSIGAVIEDPSGAGVHGFEARGQYAWFGYDNPADANRRGLARADLAHNTEDGVPAWAADLASTALSGSTVSVATWTEGADQFRLFCVSGSGLWAQTDELVDQGTLDIGWLGMGSPERKSLQSVSVSHEELHGTIAVRVTNEAGQDVTAATETQTTYSSGELARTLSGELMDLQLVLERSLDDPTLGPVLRRWTTRVVPAPASVDEIMVPILLAETVEDSLTEAQNPYDTFNAFRFLKEIENERRVVAYREGQATYLVTVRSVGMEGADDWSTDRRFMNGVLMVRLVTCDGVPPQLPGGTFS